LAFCHAGGGIGFALCFDKEKHNVKLKLSLWLTAMTVFIVLSDSRSFAAATPMDEIRLAVTQVVQILKQPGMETPKERKVLLEEIEKIVDPIFDFHQMARSSLALHWRHLTPQEQEEFVRLFKTFLRQSYLDNITARDIDHVVFSRQTLDKDFARVETKLIAGTGEPIGVVYLLEKSDSDWKVYDVVIDNVSIVNNYRAQFDRVIAQSSYQELVTRIKDKVAAS